MVHCIKNSPLKNFSRLRLLTNPIIIEFVYCFFRFFIFGRWLERRALAFRGRSGSLLGAIAPLGSPLDALFPQEPRTFRSNQLCFNSKIEHLLPTVYLRKKPRRLRTVQLILRVATIWRMNEQNKFAYSFHAASNRNGFVLGTTRKYAWYSYLRASG